MPRLKRDRRGRFLKKGSSRRRRSNPGTSYAANPKRKRRRRSSGGRRKTRRNPPAFLRRRGGLVGTVMGGLQDGALVLVGDVVSGAVPGFLKQDKTTPVGLAIRGGAGVGLAIAADMLGFKAWGRMLAAGAFAGVAKNVGSRLVMQWPAAPAWLTQALNDYPPILDAAGNQVGSYYIPPPPANGALAAWPGGSQVVDPYRTSLAAYPGYYQAAA